MPDWLSFGILFYGFFGIGSVIVMTVVATFALRGKLPGTPRHFDRNIVRSGFPVISNRDSDGTGEKEESFSGKDGEVVQAMSGSFCAGVYPR